MKINKIYPNTSYSIDIKGVKINSKECTKDDLFVCIKGITSKRIDYIDEAIEKGIAAAVVDCNIKKDIPIIKVKNTNKELKRICNVFYDYPYKKLFIIGITGTTGKTTVSEIIKHLIGDNCAYLGTNGKKYKNITESIRNTTPDVDRLYKYMKEFVDNNCTTLSMEASSEAFYRNRLEEIEFDISLITNIEEDHLNVHKTINNYVDCKCQLFRQTKRNGIAIINSNTKYIDKIKKSCKSKIYTYGFNKKDDLYIKKYKIKNDRTIIHFKYKNKQYKIKSKLLGSFNVENLCGAILTALLYGKNMKEIKEKLKTLENPIGRMENLNFNTNYKIILDYAHTTDALDKVLTYLNKIKKGRIITVTGSAGGREKEKRPLMGNIVLNKSDLTIFTMDDPRNEDIDEIINQLIGNNKNKNYLRIINRKEAIYKALSIAKKNDIVLIAGKGRDNYMAVGDKYIPYNDYDVIKNYYKNN